ncbi:hypothetical protein KOR42_20340 [Thalassoglobus neptunius]|uniref:Uncharacterized protein n=1 Tax=Thalassoglobus neptunius TaxID=1938619 RepID=A0A5C5X9W2_9PLAN|nr:hypothetical protein KOR42_20340 [Thalassoglobus neptunius]
MLFAITHGDSGLSLAGDPGLSRSYLAVRHLLRQLELKKNSEKRKAIIPHWFAGFVDQVSALFEPFSGVARVGYECTQAETGWEVSMFLGQNETVGGADDGQLKAVNFRFDMKGLSDCFDSVESIHWNAFPRQDLMTADSVDLSFLTVIGEVQSSVVKLQLHTSPPMAVGPAMRHYPDGRVELV